MNERMRGDGQMHGRFLGQPVIFARLLTATNFRGNFQGTEENFEGIVTRTAELMEKDI